MKILKKIAIAFLLLSVLSINVYSQSADKEKILISGTRLTHPLFEKWIEEYQKINPGIEIRILPQGTTEKSNLSISSYKIPEDKLKSDYEYIHVVRYALLPVTNILNPKLIDYQQHGLSEKDIKNLFFEGQNDSKDKSTASIYTRQKQSCAPIAFANHYGLEQANIKGTKVEGDDRNLINEVKKDPNGITYNNLGFIYDLKSRKVNDGLAVIPLDLNGNGKLDKDEKIYGTLDDVLKTIESVKPLAIPTEYVTLSFQKENSSQYTAIKQFIDYILNKGIQYSHHYGFLSLDSVPLPVANSK